MAAPYTQIDRNVPNMGQARGLEMPKVLANITGLLDSCLIGLVPDYDFEISGTASPYSAGNPNYYVWTYRLNTNIKTRLVNYWDATTGLLTRQDAQFSSNGGNTYIPIRRVDYTYDPTELVLIRAQWSVL